MFIYTNLAAELEQNVIVEYEQFEGQTRRWQRYFVESSVDTSSSEPRMNIFSQLT